MEDVKFHQCVRLSRFENDRTISFIPPDGEFELMSYRLSQQVKPLVWVEASVESHRGSRVEYMVKVRGQFKRRSTANNVEIWVPVPDDADSPKFRVRLLVVGPAWKLRLGLGLGVQGSWVSAVMGMEKRGYEGDEKRIVAALPGGCKWSRPEG